MTLSIRLNGQQGAAGLPLRLSVLGVATTQADWDLFGTVVIGVTADDTPPAAFADILHSTVTAYNEGNAFWNSSVTQDNQAFQIALPQSHGFTAQYDTFKPLDSNYVVGRRIWAAIFSDASPGPTAVPNAVSRPYLIR